ncbi:GNAT family N-acetyltransferase [Reichenbachiella versicolor]|uniref:GNAT family N-acetyltransferase n=1 Tax=Reichenbachiella versicolor TaxID=1821036 RepID=UPI000D6E1EC5|nr:GNAT family N-acetyltransferase [Reichenbachiella versicolor]
MNKLSIRKIEKGDLIQLSILGKETYIQTFSETWLNKDSLNQFLEETFGIEFLERDIEHNESMYFIISGKQEDVGYFKLSLTNEKVLYLKKIYLLKKAKGQNIGRLSIDFIENFCRKKQIQEIQLDVLSTNDSAISFYTKCGFSEINRTANYIDPERPELIVMQKIISEKHHHLQ